MFLQQVDSETHQQIDNLLVLYNKNEGKLPVDVELIVDSLADLIGKEISLIEKDFGDKRSRDFVSPGLVLPIQGGFCIEVNHFNSCIEKRFTVGHEIGHILHTFDYTIETPRQIPARASYGAFRVNDEEEDICDEIAMYIFCPWELVVNFVNNFHSIPCQIELFREKQKPAYLLRMEWICKKFGISISKFEWYVKKHFGEEKLLSLKNSTQ